MNIAGDDVLIDGGCTGNSACYNLAANYVRIQTGACVGSYACEKFTYGNISIGEGSCSSIEACQKMAGTVSIRNSSCIGEWARQLDHLVAIPKKLVEILKGNL